MLDGIKEMSKKIKMEDGYKEFVNESLMGNIERDMRLRLSYIIHSCGVKYTIEDKHMIFDTEDISSATYKMLYIFFKNIK